MSVLELSRLAKVSPKTIERIEATGKARFDAVARLAKALGQPVDQWLKLAGHRVSSSKIDEVFRTRPEQIAPFPRISFDKFFDRTEERFSKYGWVLRCVCVLSSVAINTPGLMERIKKVITMGFDVALVTPFPIADVTISQLTKLSKHYNDAHDWACTSARNLRKIPEVTGRVHVFTPATPEKGAILVYPPLRVSSIRPIFTEYRDKDDPTKRDHEFGVYIHPIDNTPDQWIDIYSGDAVANEHAVAAFEGWYDYFREIVDAWTPGKGRDPYDLDKLRFWRLAPLDHDDELLLAKTRTKHLL